MADEKSLSVLLEEARAKVEAMSPEEYAAMVAEQAKSFARGMMARCEHGEFDFEQCPKCREKYR